MAGTAQTHKTPRRGIVKSAKQAGFLPQGLTPSVDRRPTTSQRHVTPPRPTPPRPHNPSPLAHKQSQIIENPRGPRACRCKDRYKGTVPPQPSTPPLQLELTADGRRVLEPVRKQLFHPNWQGHVGGIDVLV